MYLAVFEILQREKCKEKVPGMLQLFCVIIGFLVIMCLDITGYDNNISFLDLLIEIRLNASSIFSLLVIPILVPHDHEHDHGHEGHEHYVSAANENATVLID